MTEQYLKCMDCGEKFDEQDFIMHMVEEEHAEMT